MRVVRVAMMVLEINHIICPDMRLVGHLHIDTREMAVRLYINPNP